jgi:feruloyl-CoA synthase
VRGSLDAQTGGSRLIHRVLPMSEPPSIFSNEFTDKGYTNQCAALTRRAALMQLLHAEPPGAELIVLEA